MPDSSVSFVVAVSDEDVFRENVMASPDLAEGHPHEVCVRFDSKSAAQAYNTGLGDAQNDVVVFVHQDVYLPVGWTDRLLRDIGTLEEKGTRWGVLGCYGVGVNGGYVGHVYSNGLARTLGAPGGMQSVHSLDECLLVMRKSSGLRFDDRLPHFHLYGTDICLEARRRGFENFAISNVCVHNSLPVRRLPPEFWACADCLIRKWRDVLPVRTCCVVLSRSRTGMLFRRARSEIDSLRRRRKSPVRDRLAQPARVVSGPGPA